DEAGTTHEVEQSTVADSVELGGNSSNRVAFVPYADKRWEEGDLEGTLGLSFFRPFTVFANWDGKTIYLSKRRDAASTVVERIGRWQSKTLTSCPHPGCANVTLIDPLAGKPLETASPEPPTSDAPPNDKPPDKQPPDKQAPDKPLSPDK